MARVTQEEVRPSSSATATDGLAWQRAAVRGAHPSNSSLDADVLTAIAAGLAAVTLPWELRTGEVPDERRYERVLVTEAYEAWVIFWPVGGSLSLHDHGGSAGAFSVVSGHLDEAAVEGTETQVRRYAAGDTSSFDPQRVHGVANIADVPATSVHVYSPPLTSMSYFDRDESGRLVETSRDAGDWADAR